MSFSPRFAVNSVLVLSASGTLETSVYQFFTFAVTYEKHDLGVAFHKENYLRK